MHLVVFSTRARPTNVMGITLTTEDQMATFNFIYFYYISYLVVAII